MSPPNAPSQAFAREVEDLVAECLSDPSAVINAARKGSFRDLCILGECAEKLPAEFARDAFSILCTKLKVPPRPAQSSNESNAANRVPEFIREEFKETWFSIFGISKIVTTFFKVPSEKAYYMPLVTKFWENLLESTEYVMFVMLDAIVSSPDPNAAPARGNLTGFKSAAFSHIAGLYLTVYLSSETLSRDQRSAKILIKIWANTAPSDPNVLMFTRGLRKLHVMPSRQLLEWLMQECDNSVDRVAQLVKERLIISLKRANINYEEVEGNVMAIIMLCCDEQRSFRAAFLKIKGIIGAATDGFIALGKDSKAFNAEKMHTIETCAMFYFDMFRSQAGIPWIIEGVRRGYFEVLARFSSAYTSNENAKVIVDSTKMLLSRVLPSHLVLFSVIGAVGSGLDSSGHLLKALSKSACIVKDEWEIFSSIALERIIQKHIYEKINWASKSESLRVMCSTCCKADAWNTFKKCAGCQAAFYCSKECQIEDWKKRNHKGECKDMAGYTDSVYVRQRDEKFLLGLAQQEISRHLPGLRKIAERDFPGVPRRKLGYILDYRTVPITFGHFRLDDDVMGEGENQSLTRLELRKKALESNGRGSFVSLRVHQGSGSMEKNITVNVKEESPSAIEVEFKRAVGQDARGNLLETRSDAVDVVLHDLGIKDPVSWLSSTQTPVKHLCERIDAVMVNHTTQIAAAVASTHARR
ncbi:hypothetical protein SCHPADRAFT_995485 [Schizopora paradoxa]|uniref:MYND-type domain-containing protein n=1 Tax=Schizopora paradoxa TaxID=27342 RepID=A0A0H2S2L3_9AGAM|nr:hypothetical protein SCHPADRAFT_995485 [Schizopora paradoxa]